MSAGPRVVEVSSPSDDNPMPRYMSAGVDAARMLWDSPEIEVTCILETEAYVRACELDHGLEHPTPTPYKAWIEASGAPGDEPTWKMITRATRELRVTAAAIDMDNEHVRRAFGTLGHDILSQLAATADLLECAARMVQIERRAAQLALHAVSLGEFTDPRTLRITRRALALKPDAAAQAGATPKAK